MIPPIIKSRKWFTTSVTTKADKMSWTRSEIPAKAYNSIFSPLLTTGVSISIF
jgi:hypothetical protein